ncbi:hypothetical protein OROHE_024735 [Orobanche hederae]
MVPWSSSCNRLPWLLLSLNKGGPGVASSSSAPYFSWTRMLCSSSVSSEFERVGFIGLGNMGSRMANSLIKSGYNVVVHDVDHDVMNKFSEKGILTSNSPLEVAKTSDAVISMLPSSSQVMDVYMGPKGILNNGGDVLRSWLFIDSSTVDPQTSRKLSAAISNRGTGRVMLDAPVSGGVLSADTGSLTFMVLLLKLLAYYLKTFFGVIIGPCNLYL